MALYVVNIILSLINILIYLLEAYFIFSGKNTHYVGGAWHFMLMHIWQIIPAVVSLFMGELVRQQKLFAIAFIVLNALIIILRVPGLFSSF